MKGINMVSIIKSVIAHGGYDLVDMLSKIDMYYVEGKLTYNDREELYELARDGADAFAAIDVAEKLAEFEKRIAALESGGDVNAEDYKEYVPGKWYYRDAKIIFVGKRYHCTAPDGVVCTWSPLEYPAYWEEDAV